MRSQVMAVVHRRRKADTWYIVRAMNCFDESVPHAIRQLVCDGMLHREGNSEQGWLYTMTRDGKVAYGYT